MPKRDPDHARFEAMHRRAAGLLASLRKAARRSRKPAWSDFRGLMFLFLMLLTVSFVLLWVGDKVNASGMAVTRFVARAQAPLSGEFYPSAHRDDIVVLQYDQEFLDANGTPWPISYGEHAQWLLRLGELPEGRRPRAIFLDVSFGQERRDPSIAELKAALCKLERAGVPIFIAALRSPRADGLLKVRSGLRSNPLTGEPDCFKLVGVDYAPDPVDRIAWSYPLSTHRDGDAWRDGPAPTWATPVYRSAAMAMAQDVGLRDLDPKEGCSRDWGPIDLGEETAPMALVWGSRPPPATDGFQPPSYCESNPSASLRYVPGFLRSLIAQAPDRPLCPYHRSFSMARVGELSETALASLVANRYVMIGADVPGYNDLVDSPVHGLVPGIHLHAMALDNFLTYKDGYKQTTEWGVPPAPSLMLSASVAVLVVLFIHLGWSALSPDLPKWLPMPKTTRSKATPAGAARDVRTLIVRVVDGLIPALAWFVRVVLQTVVAISLIALLQRWFRIGMLPVSELVAMTLAAEAFGHVEKIRTFLIGPATK